MVTELESVPIRQGSSFDRLSHVSKNILCACDIFLVLFTSVVWFYRIMALLLCSYKSIVYTRCAFLLYSADMYKSTLP